MEGFGDLNCQLTRGCQHQCLWSIAVEVKLLQNRQRKGRRLAGPRRGLPDHITPGQQQGNGLYLNGGGRLIANIFHRTCQGLDDP